MDLSIADCVAKAKEAGVKITAPMISYYRIKVRDRARGAGEPVPGRVGKGGGKLATSADARFTKLVIEELGIARAELLLATLRKQLASVTG